MNAAETVQKPEPRKVAYQRHNIVLSQELHDWLDATVERIHAQTGEKLSRSDLIRAGLRVLRYSTLDLGTMRSEDDIALAHILQLRMGIVNQRPTLRPRF